MANGKFINIGFPFKDSTRGFFLDLTDQDNDAIKSDLIHLLLTRKGQRLYNPDFGTDLLKYIFEPQDGLTFDGIKSEITDVVKKYLPGITLDDLTVEPSPDYEYAAIVTIKYRIIDGIFESSEIITLNL